MRFGTKVARRLLAVVPSRGWRAVVALLTVAVVVAACAGERTADRGRRSHLLVIALDTARADRFSYAGPSPVPTPAVDALAAEGTAFLQAISPAPLTLPAHASLFTGQVPGRHGVRNNGTYRLTEPAVTLAELCRQRDYRTGAFVGASVLDRKYGLDQGFEHYDDVMAGPARGPGLYTERSGGMVVDAALGWVGQQAGATFVWVHLFDPHIPYRPPEPERSRYAASPYDGEIAYADRMIGRLLAGYRDLGLYDDTVVVFASDHGESLGDHGELTHGVFLYDATVRVPLLIRAPGLGRGARVESQVRLIDVLPTVAEILHLPLPEGVEGVSLVPAMRGEVGAAAAATFEALLPEENYGWFQLRGVRGEGWKLVEGGCAELFELASDPAERRNLAALRPGQVTALRRRLDRESRGRRPVTAQRFALDDATRRQLVALGYLTSRGPAPEADRRDPRERHLARRLDTVRELWDRGLRREAGERCWELRDRRPQAARVTEVCGPILAGGLGTELGATSADLVLAQAEGAVRQGEFPRMRQALTRLAALLAAGDAPSPDVADRDPERQRRATVLGRIGGACWAAGEYRDAVHAYLLAARLMPADPRVHYNAGLAWERISDMSEALRAYDRTLALDPDFPKARRHRDYAAAVLRQIQCSAAPEPDDRSGWQGQGGPNPRRHNNLDPLPPIFQAGKP